MATSPYSFSLARYLSISIVVILGIIYFLPNIYAPDPALQVAPSNSGVVLDDKITRQISKKLIANDITSKNIVLEKNGTSIIIRFSDVDSQLAAKTILEDFFGLDFVIALLQAQNTPKWLQSLGSAPINLGLDLRGGVHFLLEVDTKAVVESRILGLSTQAPELLRKERAYYRAITSNDQQLMISFNNYDNLKKAMAILKERFPNAVYTADSENLFFTVKYSKEELNRIEQSAVEQNIVAIRNRVNEIGVSEPIVQRQSSNRIIVQLPGIQDTASAKRIIGKTANLELKLEYSSKKPKARERFSFKDEEARTAYLEKTNIVTGNDVSDASVSFDENSRVQVNITLSSEGGAKMHRITRHEIGRRMGVLFIEYKSRFKEQVNAEGEVEQVIESVAEKSIISLATIQDALGVQFRITGVGSQAEAAELVLLLKAGALAAPMIFLEENTIGPSLGAKNIAIGINSVLGGIALVLLFMIVYYRLLGLFAVVSLFINISLIIAIMSVLGATLTLPGFAGLVLTMGMAVDANVLIFERIKEEIKKGSVTYNAIQNGFDRAWITILDANVTTLIVAIILYLIGTGPVKGFAVTLSIGILTSMFSAIMCCKAMVTLYYSGARVRQKISI